MKSTKKSSAKKQPSAAQLAARENFKEVAAKQREKAAKKRGNK